MNTNLTCSQVMALINFYIEGKLNPILKKYVDLHIQNCNFCRRKVEELKHIFRQYDIAKNDTQNNNEINDNIDKELIKNLSAYMDNELNSTDNIRIKKITISNPNARKKLESMYRFQKLLHSAYRKTKNDIKTDYAKSIVSCITDNSEEYVTMYFKTVAVLFVVILFGILFGFLYLYF